MRQRGPVERPEQAPPHAVRRGRGGLQHARAREVADERTELLRVAAGDAGQLARV